MPTAKKEHLELVADFITGLQGFGEKTTGQAKDMAKIGGRAPMPRLPNETDAAYTKREEAGKKEASGIMVKRGIEDKIAFLNKQIAAHKAMGTASNSDMAKLISTAINESDFFTAQERAAIKGNSDLLKSLHMKYDEKAKLNEADRTELLKAQQAGVTKQQASKRYLHGVMQSAKKEGVVAKSMDSKDYKELESRIDEYSKSKDATKGKQLFGSNQVDKIAIAKEVRGALAKIAGLDGAKDMASLVKILDELKKLSAKNDTATGKLPFHGKSELKGIIRDVEKLALSKVPHGKTILELRKYVADRKTKVESKGSKHYENLTVSSDLPKKLDLAVKVLDALEKGKKFSDDDVKKFIEDNEKFTKGSGGFHRAGELDAILKGMQEPTGKKSKP